MQTPSPAPGPAIDQIVARALTFPTDAPESDGTLAWDSTTMVLIEARAGGMTGIGYTYGSAPIASYVETTLAAAVAGADAHAVPAAWMAMQRAVRNDGRTGLAAMAISAVDTALWDLSARLCGLSLADRLGRVHDAVPVYGSGGFTSYDDDRLAAQLGGWVRHGIPRVKMKVGRHPDDDRHRLRVARDAIGQDVELFVDANGAFGRSEASRWAEVYAEFGVTYVEEPVSSDDLEGLRLVRDRAPAGVAVAAGEYGYNPAYFARMVDVVDIQQADVTRCGGFTGLRMVGALCQARQVPFSAHCAPALSVHGCAAIAPLAHLEYFHDHVRIESTLFDGTPELDAGTLRPGREGPGHGLAVREEVAARYAC